MQYYKVILLLVGIVLVTACNQRQPDEFSISAEDALTTSVTSPALLTATQAMQMVEKTDMDYVLVDVRTPIEYNVGHLDGAVNIPRENFLDKATLQDLETENKHFILYGNTPVEANGLWMFLRQLGYENVSVLAADYEDVLQGIENAGADLEKARYDFLALIDAAKKEDQAEEDATKPKVVKRAPAPRKVVVPKKKKVVVEEEEGC